MERHVIVPARRVFGDVRVPGDKSISHRALLIAGIGEGSCDIIGASSSLDVLASRKALGSLGVHVIGDGNPQVEDEYLSTREFDWKILVNGRGFQGLREPDRAIDCANSGTTARTILGILAGRPFTTSLQGDKSLSRRPMARVVAPLRSMGARIEGERDGDRLPLRVYGRELTGISYRSPVPSAQIKTCLMLAGLQAEGETVVEEPATSRDHTERMLEYLGVSVERTLNRVVVKSTNIQNASVLKVPGDISSAAFLLVAAAILPGSRVSVRELGVNPTRTGILDVLRRFGAAVEVTDAHEECGEPRATVTVSAGDRRPVSVSGDEIPRLVDELPLVAVLGAYAEGESTIADAAELRVKESDRIAGTAGMLGAMGVDVVPTPDGMTIRGGGPLRGASVDANGDHRIAMAAAVAALGAEGETAIQGWDSVAVSYPRFGSALEDLIER